MKDGLGVMQGKAKEAVVRKYKTVVKRKNSPADWGADWDCAKEACKCEEIF